jgi:hypothetical protein
MITPLKHPCRGGEIGRHAWFRSMCGQPRGGSSPLSGTIYKLQAASEFSDAAFFLGGTEDLIKETPSQSQNPEHPNHTPAPLKCHPGLDPGSLTPNAPYSPFTPNAPRPPFPSSPPNALVGDLSPQKTTPTHVIPRRSEAQTVESQDSIPTNSPTHQQTPPQTKNSLRLRAFALKNLIAPVIPKNVPYSQITPPPPIVIPGSTRDLSHPTPRDSQTPPKPSSPNALVGDLSHQETQNRLPMSSTVQRC